SDLTRAVMRVSAAGIVAAQAIFVVPLIANIMPVIGDRHDLAVRIRIGILSRLPVVQSTRYDVIQMRNYACRNERAAIVIPIYAPLVASALGEDFEFLRD